MIIKRVEPFSCAKIAGIIYAGLGLLFGIVFSLFALLGLAFSGFGRGLGQNGSSSLAGMVGSVVILVGAPIVYGLLGFVAALVGAWIYNLVASKVGGLQIEVA